MEGVDWELAISKIAGLILKEQSANQLIQIRGLMYELLSRSIQPDLIMKRLAFELADKMDLPMQKVVIEKAAYHVS